jgi:glycosyltransferase involved in cell wall biosynthesis
MLVSVYMPTKNRLQLLQRAVESVLNQTHRELELWVVDDGSTDGTHEYLLRLSATDPRVRFIRNERSQGAPRARNLAIERASGEFVTGLDDDDRFDPRRIERLLAAWRQHAASGEKFSCLYTQDVMESDHAAAISRKPARVTYEDMFFHNLIGNQVFTRREYMIAAGLFDEQMPAWQDLDMFMRLLRVRGPALLVDEPLYHLTLEQRSDRISVSSTRIEAAYARLAAKVADHPRVLQQGLFLQRFGRLYGYGLTFKDFRTFWRFGVHVRTARRLGGILLRQLASAASVRGAAASREVKARPRELRVLMFPKHGDNPYLETLCRYLEERGVRIDDFTFDRAFNERYDVVHLHWPDLHLHGRSALRVLAKHVRLALLFGVLRWRKTRIVWTIHNLKPHERHLRLGEWLFPLWFPRLCTHVIALTTSSLEAARAMYPVLRGKASAVIPHGHYRNAYPPAPSREEARTRLGLESRYTFLFFGNIRPYKNVPHLIEAFRAMPHQDVQLVIAGQPGPAMDGEALRQLAAGDARIRLWLEFISDEQVPMFIAASDLVVLPFDNILNSGSVLLALSFDRPVLAPRLGSLPDIQYRVGARWVSLFDGPLTTGHLISAFDARSIGEHEKVDLSFFDWDHIAQQTLECYRMPPDAPGLPPQPAKRSAPLPDTR